ncbi:MAG TPA: hypothetical protein VFL70_01645 [Bacteroidia bacterium]|nr:hypothetical protein [Bacteroidia bacterium]
MKNRNTYLITILTIAGLVLFFSVPSVAQCSMCRKVATDGTASRLVGNGLNKGILYLLAFPYFLMVFIFRKHILNFVRSFSKK